jgi:hypothetical protein
MAKRLYGVDPIERFNQKYIVDPETGCWNWTEPLTKFGYGRFKLNGKSRQAHQVSYELFKGERDLNLSICHFCNNRKCVNPDHLRQDTHSSNMIDKLYIKTNNIQKLSVDEVIEIKKSLQHYYRGQLKDLAHFYKVDPETIGAIKRGYRWSHVQI